MSGKWTEPHDLDGRAAAPSPQPVDHLQVRVDEAAARYEGRLAGELASVVDYRIDGRTLTVLHTGTEPRFRGRGVAGQLTRAVLEDARARGLTVRPLCPYTATFIDEHPAFHDLLA
jgi:predicted GNAT family acetyltransferase